MKVNDPIRETIAAQFMTGLISARISVIMDTAEGPEDREDTVQSLEFMSRISFDIADAWIQVRDDLRTRA